MPKDIILPMAVCVSRPQANPEVLRTVQQAIDWIYELSELHGQKAHWHQALNDLLDANEVRDTRFLNKARWSLLQAVREEGWLR